MIEFHYTHNHTPKCSRYKKQRNSYTTHICNRSMFCPVLMYTFQEFWSKYLLTDLAFQTGILIKVLVLSWKRRWWRLICGLSKSHFAFSPSKSAARRRSPRGPMATAAQAPRRSPRGPMATAARAPRRSPRGAMATAARAPRAAIRFRQSRCAPQFYRAFPFPSLLAAAAQLSRVRPNQPTVGHFTVSVTLGIFKAKVITMYKRP